MNIIIPLAGDGKRFANDGYTQPKPLINALFQPIVFWLLNSLKLKDNDKIYICYKSDLNEFNFIDRVKHTIGHSDQIEFIELNTPTRGAAETTLLCAQQIHNSRRDEPSLILDGDTFYTEDILSIIRKEINKNIIFYTIDKSEQPIYSYISFDKKKDIINIIEKNKISDYACIGAYCFQSTNLMIKAINDTIQSDQKQKGEFYISSVYRQLLKEKTIIQAKEFSHFTNLGTPKAVKVFASNLNKDKKKYRFCFDIDNTLLSYPKIEGDYSSVQPITKNINFLQNLYSQGHTIILYTARRMRTHGGNIGKVQADICRVTLDSLDKYNIPYHEIYFGKPYAHFYIDDLGINAFDNLEKLTGIYNIHASTRDHNYIKIENNNIIKTSKNISGEKFYYKNIPNNLLSFFPRLISYTDDSIVIEKIDGIPLSSIYTNKFLTDDILHRLLDTLSLIHTSCEENKINDINIYANYVSKLEERVQSYDYSVFPDFKIRYNKIIKDLRHYENNKLGKIGMIHGDPVFTNILIDLQDNIKFIDMRGLLGSTHSIYGDIFYDYAKIYQSLVGYDFVLMDKTIDKKYSEHFIELFNKYIINKFCVNTLENIKTITNSLFLSLIPLHNNDKIFKYYNLIDYIKE